MSKLIIDYAFLLDLDKFFQIEEINKYEDEIENIVSRLWLNLGDSENYMRPAFGTFLQTNLLRPIYICYFSMKELTRQFDEIVINNSTTLLDIVAKHFNINLPEDRKNHDQEFGYERFYSFNKGNENIIKNYLRRTYCFMNAVRGIDVLYLNAGKLNDDFKKINNAMSATFISKKNLEVGIEAKEIEQQSKLNIKDVVKLIPKKIIFDLLQCRVYCHLNNYLSHIKIYVNFIKQHDVKLIIISAATHEDSLTLLAAANITCIKTLSIGHGYTTVRNNFIDECLDFQGTINNIEYQYSGVRQIKLHMSWFDEKNRV